MDVGPPTGLGPSEASSGVIDVGPPRPATAPAIRMALAGRLEPRPPLAPAIIAALATPAGRLELAVKPKSGITLVSDDFLEPLPREIALGHVLIGEDDDVDCGDDDEADFVPPGYEAVSPTRPVRRRRRTEALPPRRSEAALCVLNCGGVPRRVHVRVVFDPGDVFSVVLETPAGDVDAKAADGDARDVVVEPGARLRLRVYAGDGAAGGARAASGCAASCLVVVEVTEACYAPHVSLLSTSVWTSLVGVSARCTLVTAAEADALSAMTLTAEAPPFVPEGLRTFFDTPLRFRAIDAVNVPWLRCLVDSPDAERAALSALPIGACEPLVLPTDRVAKPRAAATLRPLVSGAGVAAQATAARGEAQPPVCTAHAAHAEALWREDGAGGASWDWFQNAVAFAATASVGRAMGSRVAAAPALVAHLARLRAQLWLEQSAADGDVSNFDVFEAEFKLRGVVSRKEYAEYAPFMARLKVPGLAEGSSARPPLRLGDGLRLRLTAESWRTVSKSQSMRRCKRRHADWAQEGVLIELRCVVVAVRDDEVEFAVPRVPLTEAVHEMPPGDRDIFGCVGERAKCAPLRWHVRFVSSHTGADFAQAAITEAARRALVFAALLEPPGADKPPGADAPRPADCADGGAGADEDGADEEGADASLNAAQRRAVSAITGPRSQNGGCVLLFGPPGTGKTKTVVAAIDAVLRRKPHARVLACAPSDEAADLLATRLLGCGSVGGGASLLRLNWWQRKIESVDRQLLSSSKAVDGVLDVPSKAAIAAARVVVSTCGCAGLLLLAQLGGGHFTHIVVDEAAQALEPECLCALALAGPETRVALSGDPWQLGPHVASRAAMQLGLGKSLLQRLMEQRESAGNGATVVRLCENYRAHAALLEVPSRLFYASKLREAADRDVTSSLLPWEHGGFALLTWGVCGRHMRELDSPSFFNPLEAHKVAELISLLVRSKTVQCEPKDVGVLSLRAPRPCAGAFRKQVLKLRTLLRSLGLGAVSVGQVYDFQGAEMRVVIVSTTLSSRPFVGTASAVDGAALPPIGLLDARRFNVAITRAKALCIVVRHGAEDGKRGPEHVGHPHLLMTEPYWCDLVKYCQDHDAYRGARCPGDDDGGAESVVDRASALLGSADFDVMYPTDLHTIYSSESSWRIIL